MKSNIQKVEGDRKNMDPRDTSKYGFTVEAKNHLDNARKEKSRIKIGRKEGIVAFALLFLSYFLVIVLFGWTALSEAAKVSSIVFFLTLFWFTKGKAFLIIGLLMIIASVVYYADSLGYI